MSRMARLGGEFAMLVLVTIPENNVDAMLDDIRELEVQGLFARVRKTDTSSQTAYEGYVPYDVRVSGADHPGIIHQVTHEMAQWNVNIESMDTKVTDAPLSGAPLFTMNAVVYAPASVEYEDLASSLDRLEDSLAVDIDISPHSGNDL
jgi:glycine cleavage system transcriptional repressor